MSGDVAYTTAGAAAGSCRHRHATIAEAVECLTGDRYLLALDGSEQRPLSDVEFAAMVGVLEQREARKATS